MVFAGTAAAFSSFFLTAGSTADQTLIAAAALLLTVLLARLTRALVSAERQRVRQSLIEALPNPVYFKHADGRFGGVNRAWESFFGMPRDVVIGRTAQELEASQVLPVEGADVSDDTLWRHPGFRVYEDVISTKDGARHDAIVCKATYVRRDGDVGGMVGTIIDMTGHKRAERRLSMQHAVTRVLAEAQTLNEVVPTIIKTMCETMGWHYGALYKYYPEADVLRCEEMWGVDQPRIRLFMAAAGKRVVRPDGHGKGLIRRTFESGKPIWISNVAAEDTLRRKDLIAKAGLHGAFAFPVRAGNQVLGIVEFFHADVLEPDPMVLEIAEAIGIQMGQYIVRTRAEAERYLARHDFVTGLPNRVTFNERVQHALAQAQRHRRRLAVMFIDLDRFKHVNDTLGHEAGDTLLKDVARRLQANLRAGDTVARLGGDEFVMLLEDITNEHDMLFVGQKLISELAAPCSIAGQEVSVTASIGVATYPSDGLDAASLLRNADAAMYRAKSQGRNLCCLYSGAEAETSE